MVEDNPPKTGYSLKSVFAEFTNLLAPKVCAGCGSWDTDLCPKCYKKLFAPVILVPEFSVNVSCPVFARGIYGDNLRAMILAHKHSNISLQKPFEKSGKHMGQENCIRNLFLPQGEEIWVIPAPSSTKKSKISVAQAFATGLAQGLTQTAVTDVCEEKMPLPNAWAQKIPERIRVIEVLKLRRGARGQSGLGSQERETNREGQVYLSLPSEEVKNFISRVQIMLVDDVCATGATLGQMAKVLIEAGFNVRGAVVLASSKIPV